MFLISDIVKDNNSDLAIYLMLVVLERLAVG